MKQFPLFCFFFLVAISGFGAEILTTSPSGRTQIEFRVSDGIGPSTKNYEVYLLRAEIKPQLVSDELPEILRSWLGLSNLPEREFRWIGERYCVTTISYGFGILDTEEAKWVDNIDVTCTYGKSRRMIVYILPCPYGRLAPPPHYVHTIGTYHFDSKNNLTHKTFPLEGRVVTPLFRSSHGSEIAFIQRSRSGKKELVVFDTWEGKVLAKKPLPKWLSKQEVSWYYNDSDKKAVRRLRREWLGWIDSATKYGPFREPEESEF